MVSTGDGHGARQRALIHGAGSTAESTAAASIAASKPIRRGLSTSWMIVLASFLFASMGVCVKLASNIYSPGEIVTYRGLTGAAMMIGLARWKLGTLRTTVPSMHLWRSLSGATALCLWFYAISQLPLATAMTLNYMSSVWMALFLLGGAVALGSARVDGRLIGTVLLGFIGVALILRPTIAEQQLWYGLLGLLSGILSATAYLQVTALGRVGEPEYRIVFYFSLGGISAGSFTMLWSGGLHAHTWKGAALLLAVGVLATTAQLLLTRAYSTGRPLVNASLQYLGIVFSCVYGVLLFNDAVTWMALLGMLLIVVAGLSATLLRSRSAPPDTANAPLES